MNPYAGDRQLEPDEQKTMDCWSCDSILTEDEVLDSDGICPSCGAEIMCDEGPGEPNYYPDDQP